tara:strand:- start:427 stop:771 length:345 start_codon:yes stop_codon:yes gene_type:complete
VARQLAFAGIAVIWIFTNNEDGGMSLPASLLWPALIFVSALASDFLQYVSMSLVWFFFTRHKEKQLGADFEGSFSWSPAINYPGYTFFWLKCSLVLAGYLLLGVFIYQQIKLVS